ncbi:MAG: hypothetical protein ACRBI6_04585 [Acidimicrobiales bacterium]
MDAVELGQDVFDHGDDNSTESATIEELLADFLEMSRRHFDTTLRVPMSVLAEESYQRLDKSRRRILQRFADYENESSKAKLVQHLLHDCDSDVACANCGGEVGLSVGPHVYCDDDCMYRHNSARRVDSKVDSQDGGRS